ncbi:serine-arginine protein 55-like [Anastrepha ludens]|uniref:serine-arginine protein 55-like n=1 Tax=Anastrepha ludens TaxID=28586 RepID=UPI0023B18F32|nr:serine-arginine protein 55-like [Anastrepha ludens]
MSSSRVFVGGLAYCVREKDLVEFFKGYGRTCDVLLKNGYGFVEFENHRDADDAVDELNGKSLMGRRVNVELAKSRVRGNCSERYGSKRRGRYNDRSSRTIHYGPPKRTECRIVVENLSSGVNWQDLKDFMQRVGEVTYCDAHKERRNEGVVEFASKSDMEAALEELDDTALDGRRVRLVEDRRRRKLVGGKRERSRSRSDTRSRSKSVRSSPRPHSSPSEFRELSTSKLRSPVAKRLRSEIVRVLRTECHTRDRATAHRSHREGSPSKSITDSQSWDRSTCSSSRSRSASPENGKSTTEEDK